MKKTMYIILLSMITTGLFAQTDINQQANSVKSALDKSTLDAKALIDLLLSENVKLKQQAETALKAQQEAEKKLKDNEEKMKQFGTELEATKKKAAEIEAAQKELKAMAENLQKQLNTYKSWIEKVIVNYLEPLGKLFKNATTSIDKDIEEGKNLTK